MRAAVYQGNQQFAKDYDSWTSDAALDQQPFDLGN